MVQTEDRSKEIWGLMGWQWQQMGSACCGLQSLGRCRDTGFWT